MSIEVGAKVSGKVSGITNFGAFVDLDDNQTGLVHISQISNNYVKDIHDVLAVGDTVTVKVTKVGDDGKIALSMKDAEEHHHNNEGRDEHRHNNFHREHHERRNNNHFAHQSQHGYHGGFNSGHHQSRHHEDFNEMLAGYLKESESRLSTLKRQTDGKRGGRGGRRS
ncbi:MAG: S1 domain-containing RNA-binding protein [Limosilactobacillus sp.]|jgi:S1 RNA binding domain protein|uniref:S1 domain-containing RNA-binding protein n=1 Tax=Limosilactobacillus sp. TaxID=2773925 RepID=UPI0025C23069|nr:S1 domain-containing RNA-binding protein [Limosilactobacillus sp.]MCI1974661.1 S1 domain-containing RNA-binding protein [Limosilactobacillus sp.]MCI2031186.1 S1 domain-containing RNA-binding protein [Limosilactobacillus sp.]